MPAYSEKNSAYTLIEILVVLAILSLFLGMGYTNLRDYQRRQLVVGSAREVEGALRYAEEMALAGAKPSACASETLDGISFNTTGSASFTIRAECGVQKIDLRVKNLPTGISLNAPNPGQATLFHVLAKGVTNPKTFCVCDNYGNKAAISVSSSGEINEATCTCP